MGTCVSSYCHRLCVLWAGARGHMCSLTLSYVCYSTRAPARASVLLNAKKGELPVCNASYKGDLHELQSLAHQGPGRRLNVGEKDAVCSGGGGWGSGGVGVEGVARWGWG